MPKSLHLPTARIALSILGLCCAQLLHAQVPAKPPASGATPKPAASKPAAVPPPEAVVPMRAVEAKPIASPAMQNVNMYVGEVRTLAIKEISRVAVGNGKLMSS